MYRQKKGPLSSLITNMKTGLITRREFLQEVARLGLAGSLVELVESSCKLPPRCSATDLTWWSESYDISSYDALIPAYNIINECGITVSRDMKGVSTDYLHEQLTQRLQNQQSSPEIISMDVIWTDEFASNGWVIPLNDFWSAEEQDLYLRLPIQSSTYQGKVYAAPLWTDVGLMYYRTDHDFGRSLSATIPQAWTWDDLEGMVQYVRSRNSSDLPQYGYLWQATAPSVGPYEGLVCNFVEVLSSYGGNVIDPHNPERVTISGSAAVEALQKMRSWLAPEGISSSMNLIEDSYDENATAHIWENGGAMFMRNWPRYISSSTKDTSAVQQKFGITTLPGKTPKLTGKSCIGGWGLAINAFAPQEKREAAWNFIHWMLQKDTQVFLAIDSNFAVTIKKAYDILKLQNRFYSKIIDIINNHSQLRPKIKMYQPFSQTIQKRVYQILTDPSPDIEGSLNTLQKTLQDIIDKGKKGHS